MIVRDEAACGVHHDRGAVHQQFRRDQHAVEEHRVVGGQQKVAVRAIFGEGFGGDADRAHPLRGRMARDIDAAAADPAHRAGMAQMRHHDIARKQRFDSDLAAFGQDARAGGETGGFERQQRIVAAVVGLMEHQAGVTAAQLLRVGVGAFLDDQHVAAADHLRAA